MQSIDILFILLWLVSVAIVLWKTRQITAEIKRAKIKDPDGSLREPTMGERMAIANKLAYEKGKYFWWLVLILVFILIVSMILARTGVFQ
jgi:hypothetical protein